MEPSKQSIERTDHRISAHRPVRLAWVDAHGQVRCAPGRCIDVSNKRIHIELREQIPLNTKVLLRADGINLAGSASVKYVTHCYDSFILVLDVG